LSELIFEELTVRRASLTVLTCCFLCFVPVAHSHHGAAPFDGTREVTIEGVVTEFDYRNPHSYLHLQTIDENGDPVDVVIETIGSSLRPFGVTRDSLSPGDRVTAVINPSHSEPETWGLGVQATKEDGTVVPLSVRRARQMGVRSTGQATSLAGIWVPRGEGFLRAVSSAREKPLTELGQAAREAFSMEEHSQARCVAVPPPLLMLYSSIDDVEILDDRVLIHSDWMDAERVIYTDGRDVPESQPASVNGYSLGRWEDGALLVTTTRFTENNSGYTAGVATGSGKRLEERFELASDRAGLDYSFVLEDSEYLAEPITGETRWDYRPDLTPDDAPCDLDSAGRYLTE
jgi:hypothetical protein